MDDMVVARKKKNDHINDLAKTFANMREAKLKPNLDKCVFRVRKGKVLGCLVSIKGIEVNRTR